MVQIAAFPGPRIGTWGTHFLDCILFRGWSELKLHAGLKEALEPEYARLKTVPQCRGCCRRSDDTQGDDGQIAGDSVSVHAQIKPSKVNEDHDVNHIEAIADAAIEGQRPVAQE